MPLDPRCGCGKMPDKCTCASMPATGDVEKLIERLENGKEYICLEAAAMLRSLAGENNKLWKSNRDYADLSEKEGAEIASLRAENERLRKALVEIAAMDNCYPDVMKHLAQSSLQTDNEDVLLLE